MQITNLLSNNLSKSIIWSIKHSDHFCNSSSKREFNTFIQITLHCWLIPICKLVWIYTRAETTHTPFWVVLLQEKIPRPTPRNHHLCKANNINQSNLKIPKIRRQLDIRSSSRSVKSPVKYTVVIFINFNNISEITTPAKTRASKSPEYSELSQR